MKKSKQKKWCKPRHKFFTGLAIFFTKGRVLHKYHYKIDKFVDNTNQNYLILFNHVTPMDQFLCYYVFAKPIYFVATEDLFSCGMISRMLEYSVAPIPIDKTKTDISTIRNCIRVAKEGGNIAIAPEGNRTYSGKLCEMKQSIAKLAKAIKLPIVFVKIEGGYGVEPRWSSVVRNGKMRVGVSKVLQVDEYVNMDDAQLFEVIKNELYVNEATADGTYKSKKTAEHLERAVYTCPKCGFSGWSSKGQFAHCNKCGLTVKYGYDKRITGVDNDFPFEFVADWLDYQNSLVQKLDVSSLADQLLFVDNKVKTKLVIPYRHKKRAFGKVSLQLFANKIVLQNKKYLVEWSFDDVVGVAVMGRNKLNVNIGDKLYQFKGKASFNALKYMNLFYRYKNFKEGIENGFIGI